VKWTPLAEWVGRGAGQEVVLMRLADPSPLADGGADKLQAAATRYLGRHYDTLFQWTDDRIYCSELVYKAYQAALGLQIGAVQRMGSFDLASPAVRKLIEARTQGRIDEHEPVVAPSSLLTDPDLVVVYSSDPTLRAPQGP
jgi:hypothetical protein